MEKLKIKIQPLFVLYVFLCIYFGWYNDIFYYIVVLVLHEYGHYFATLKLGYSVEGLVFAVYGSALKSNNCYKPKDEVIIAFAGPLVNMLLILCTLSLWWLFPSLYLFTRSFLIANIMVLLFNLLPIYPLDGGRILLALFSKKKSRFSLERVSSKVCLGVGILLICLFVYSLFLGINYSFLFMGLFLMMNGVLCGNNYYISRMQAYNKKNSSPIEVKVFKVTNLNKSQLLKYLSPHYYSIFELTNGEKSERVEEKDLLTYQKGIENDIKY